MDAHIIPQWCYKETKSLGPDPMRILSSSSPVTQRSHTGVYDTTILCADCEGDYFKRADQYGSDALRDPEVVSTYRPAGHPIAQLVRGNAERVRYFALSVLWRASASRQPFFSSVDLGPLQSILANEIKSGVGPQGNSPFDVSVFCYTDSITDIPLVDPGILRNNGVRFQRVQCGRYEFLIKADTRPASSPFDVAPLRSGDQFLMMLTQFKGSAKHSNVLALMKDPGRLEHLRKLGIG